MNLRVLAARLASDALPRDRGHEYEGYLRSGLAAGYLIVPVSELHARLTAPPTADQPPVLAVRHDVDIRSPRGNERFFAIEQAVGVRATYYFRASTVEAHARLIDRLAEAGHEVGYHFEEGATIAKRYRLRTREEVFARMEDVRAEFIQNCERFRSRWSPRLQSVSSHGDWINRQLGFTNHELIDGATLATARVLFEAYQPSLMDAVDVYVSDAVRPPRQWADDYGLGDALRDRRRPLYVLLHERQWFTDQLANLRANADRAIDTARYRLSVRLDDRTAVR